MSHHTHYDGTAYKGRQCRSYFLLFAIVLRVLCLFSYSLISTYYPQHIRKSPFNRQRPSECTGFVIAAFSPTYVMGSIVIGHVALKSYSCKFCLVTGLFLTGGAWLIFAALKYVTVWRYFLAFSIALRLTIGVGVASADVASFSLVIASYPDKIGFASGLMSLTWCLGNVLGPPFGGILYDWMGFSMPAGIVGVSLLFFSFVAVFVPTVNSSEASYISDQNDQVSTKTITSILFSLWTLLSFGSAYIITVYVAFPQATLSDYMHTKFNFSPRDVGFVFLAGGVPNTILTPVVGKLCDVLHPRLFAPNGILTAAGGFFLMSFGQSIVLQYLAQIVIGIGRAFTYCSSYTDLNKEVCRKLQVDELDENATGKIYSVYMVFVNLGEITGSAVGGLSADSLGFSRSAMMWGAIGTSFGLLYLLAFVISRAYNACVAIMKQSLFY